MNSRAPSTSASPSIPGAPPIRMRHPLPPPPVGSARVPPFSRTHSQQHLNHKTTNTSQHRTSSRSARPSYTASPEFLSTSTGTSPYYSSSHPSPASTTSSAASSSLRTPPDLLVNGSTVINGIGVGKGAVVNSWNGLVVRPKKEERWLRREELERRRKLLEDLPGGDEWRLPSPPPSPKTLPSISQTAAPTSTGNRLKRRRSDSPPPPQKGKGESLTQLASSYRTAARDLKHRADARSSTLSTSRPSYLASRPSEVSALEQLDAVLLFAYAFHLDDLSAGACVAKNWTSLFGLLRYATNAQSELGNEVLLGVCRLVEAVVIRRLHRHDASVLARKVQEKQWEEVRILVERQQADLERADRLTRQSKGLLSLRNLREYKGLYERVLEGEKGRGEEADPSGYPQCMNGWAGSWPLDCLSEVERVVCFGRSAVREHARRNGVVEFELMNVGT